MIDYEAFKRLYHSIPGEPEFEIFFRGNQTSYMIIKYDDHVSFQRCGVEDGSGEYDYPSLEELYETDSVDGVCLKDVWGNIDTIIADSTFDLSLRDELKEFMRSNRVVE